MKSILGLLICLGLAGCSGEFKNSNVNLSSSNFNTPLSNYSNISPESFHDLSNTPEFRATLIEKAKPSYAANGIQININKHDDQVLAVKSSSLNKNQISDQLENSLAGFRSLGFNKIVIIDKDGEKQNIDLTKKRL